jgi:hypothetical protein
MPPVRVHVQMLHEPLPPYHAALRPASLTLVPAGKRAWWGYDVMVLDSGWHRVGLLPRSTVCTIVLLCFGKVLQHVQPRNIPSPSTQRKAPGTWDSRDVGSLLLWSALVAAFIHRCTLCFGAADRARMLLVWLWLWLWILLLPMEGHARQQAVVGGGVGVGGGGGGG